MNVLPMILVFFVVLIIGILLPIGLQFFFATRQSKWPGLILPAISLIGACIVALNALTWTAALISFLLTNIYTVVLLLIYFACREKKNVKRQVQKMNIQDLK